MSDNFIGANSQRQGRRAWAWVLLLILTLAVLCAVLIPVWLIYPFRSQTRSSLEVAYELRRWSPWLSLAASIGALALVAWLWRGARRWWRKSALVLMLVLICGAAWLARQNHFEWMFKPLPNAAYAKVNEAGFVDARDRVLAVEVEGEAVAYPIRLMAYHHVVQDEVGGTPVVATY